MKRQRKRKLWYTFFFATKTQRARSSYFFFCHEDTKGTAVMIVDCLPQRDKEYESCAMVFLPRRDKENESCGMVFLPRRHEKYGRYDR